MDSDTKNLFDVVMAAATLLAAVLSGVWAYFRFLREGAHKARIELNIDCAFFGPQDGNYLAAFSICADNKGQVEHRFADIRLRVRGIRRNEPLVPWQGHEPLLRFPSELFRDAAVVPKEFGYFFVRPGVRQRMSFVTSIPSDYSFILARVTFRYEHSDDLHTAERAFAVCASQAGLPEKDSE